MQYYGVVQDAPDRVIAYGPFCKRYFLALVGRGIIGTSQILQQFQQQKLKSLGSAKAAHHILYDPLGFTIHH